MFLKLTFLAASLLICPATSHVLAEERRGTSHRISPGVCSRNTQSRLTISQGQYLGKTVQVVPHITDTIQDWIERVAKVPADDSGEEPDVCISMSRSRKRMKVIY
jgi:hypothetical protein